MLHPDDQRELLETIAFIIFCCILFGSFMSLGGTP